MERLEKALDSLSSSSDKLISSLQEAIKEAAKDNPGKPVSVNVSAKPTPQGKWEICIGSLCWEI
ncbi:hypothetical protein [Klebsiella aerogenes]|uniref:hypothetical protein n=1 Tax=Klebsiella aerogenes TaxID=548 RepID=UPI000A7EEB49|nr:hypothetical protein [Klebsiella aerogenes]